MQNKCNTYMILITNYDVSLYLDVMTDVLLSQALLQARHND